MANQPTPTTAQNVVDCLADSLGTMLLGDPGAEHINGISRVEKFFDADTPPKIGMVADSLGTVLLGEPDTTPPAVGIILDDAEGARFKITVEKLA